MDVGELLDVLRRRRWLLLTVFVLSIGAELAMLARQPQAATAEAVLKLCDQDAETYEGSALKGLPIFDPFSAAVLDELLRDRSFESRVRERLLASDHLRLANEWQRHAFELDGGGVAKDSEFLRFRYRATTAEDAKQSLEAGLLQIQADAQSYFQTSVARGRERFAANFETAQAELAAATRELQEKLRVAALPPDGTSVDAHRRALLDLISRLEVELLEQESNVAALEAELAAEPDLLASSPSDLAELLAVLDGTPFRELITQQLNALIQRDVELERISATVTPQHPDYSKAVKARAQALDVIESSLRPESRLAQYVDFAIKQKHGRLAEERRQLLARLALAEARRGATAALCDEKRLQLATLQSHAPEIARLLAVEQRAARQSEELRKALVSFDGVEQLAPKVIDVFIAPHTSIAPAKARSGLVMVALLSLLLTGGVCYVVEFFDHRIHNLNTLRRVSRLSCLGILPDRGGVHAELPEPGSSSVSEEISAGILKKLLVTLGDGRALLITSAETGAGKTFFAGNLAATAARLGIRTVLVDCNLRAPRVHELFQAPRSPGVAELLSDEAAPVRRPLVREMETRRATDPLRLRLTELPSGGSEIAVLVADEDAASLEHTTRMPHLHVLASGQVTGETIAVFNAERFAPFLAELGERYQLVILDSPSLDTAADALLIAPLADLTVLVVRANRTRSQELQSACESLEGVGARAAGIVLNGSSRRPTGVLP